MMTTRFEGSEQQYNVERSALSPGTSDPLDTNPNILIAEDAAVYREIKAAVVNTGQHVAHANHFIDDEDRRLQLATDFVESVAYIAKPLDDEHKRTLSEHALEALQQQPESDTVKTLVSENRQATQIAGQRAVELQATREELTEIEQTLRARRTELIIRERAVAAGSDVHAQILNELRFVNSLLGREKQSPRIVNLDEVRLPTTDELEAQLAQPSAETTLSPARGTAMKRLAQTVIGFTHSLYPNR